MCKVLCITNRHLCREDFLTRLEAVAQAHPEAVVLREKDLDPAAYRELAIRAKAICDRQKVPLILHSFPEIARELGISRLHLPLPVLRAMAPRDRAWFSVLGASCHSPADAEEAQSLGCTYVTAGHVFDTDCKKGLPGRGLDFLKAVCGQVSIPVYAIGGITPARMEAVLTAGAAGACVMSGLMTCDNPEGYLNQFRQEETP